MLHCPHRTSSLHPSVPYATPTCLPLFPSLLQSSLATSVMHAEPDPSPLPLHDDGLCLSSPLPQVYAALSILIPGAQCTSCHDCSLLFEFIFSLSCQEILLSLL